MVCRPSLLKRFARAGSLILLVFLVSVWLGGAGVQGNAAQSPVTMAAAFDAIDSSAVTGACPAPIVGATADLQLASATAPLTVAAAQAQGPPTCPFLVPFCPQECHLDHACPQRCHCPGPK